MLREGIYEEIINCKLKKELASFDEANYEIEKEPIDVEEARVKLAAYISFVTRRALKYVRDNISDDREALLEQIRLCNEILTIIYKNDADELKLLKITEEAEILTAIYNRLNSVRSISKSKAIRPITPVSQSSLFTGSRYEPSMLSEIKKEIVIF